MPKQEKLDKVRELTERFKGANGVLVADFRGLSVKDATEMRRSLQEVDASFSVVKNTLTRLAARDAGLEELVGLLEGPTAIAFMSGDAVAGAKSVLEMAKRFPALGIKGSLVEGRVLDEGETRSLATIDARDVSVGKVAGMLQAPIARTVYLLQAPLQRIAYALAERGRQAEAA